MTIRVRTEERREYERRYKQEMYVRNVKYLETLKDMRGGRCEFCGCGERAILEWHHLIPEDKSNYKIHALKSKSLQTIHTEIAKCALTCPSCHMRIHRKNINIMGARIVSTAVEGSQTSML